MEADGVTRIYKLEDVVMDEALSEIHPALGARLSYQERREAIARADIIYTMGGVVREHAFAIVIKDPIATDPESLRKLQSAAELTLRKSGLTIVIDKLCPEDVRYSGEDDDYGDGAL